MVACRLPGICYVTLPRGYIYIWKILPSLHATSCRSGSKVAVNLRPKKRRRSSSALSHSNPSVRPSRTQIMVGFFFWENCGKSSDSLNVTYHITLEDERLEPTAITHEKKGKWSEPNLQGIMFQPLIFRGVSRYCRYPLHIRKIPCLEGRVCLRRALRKIMSEKWAMKKKNWLFAESIEDSTTWPSYVRII